MCKHSTSRHIQRIPLELGDTPKLEMFIKQLADDELVRPQMLIRLQNPRINCEDECVFDD